MMLDLFYHQFRQAIDKVDDPGPLRSRAPEFGYIWATGCGFSINPKSLIAFEVLPTG
jgi:hypothetical protein